MQRLTSRRRAEGEQRRHALARRRRRARRWLRPSAVGAVLALCLGFGWIAADRRADAADVVISGRVVGVADGDTLTLLTRAGRQIRIRLDQIDAPERGQPYGARAKQALSSLAYGETVRVESSGEDRYGRTLGRVHVGGRDVNAELVRRGAAWAYRRYLSDRSLLRLESEARAARRGLWALPAKDVVPPWEWRAARRG